MESSSGCLALLGHEHLAIQGVGVARGAPGMWDVNALLASGQVTTVASCPSAAQARAALALMLGQRSVALT